MNVNKSDLIFTPIDNQKHMTSSCSTVIKIFILQNHEDLILIFTISSWLLNAWQDYFLLVYVGHYQHERENLLGIQQTSYNESRRERFLEFRDISANNTRSLPLLLMNTFLVKVIQLQAEASLCKHVSIFLHSIISIVLTEVCKSTASQRR